jgi:hypothetical protein
MQFLGLVWLFAMFEASLCMKERPMDLYHLNAINDWVPMYTLLFV